MTESLSQSLASFLLRYRSTPHTTTGVTPSSLFMGRELRTRLHLLCPDVGGYVGDQQSQQKDHHDQHSHARELDIRQSVWARNFRDGPKWIQAEVSDRIGPLSYLVKLPSGETWRRHIDHLRAGLDKPSDNDTCVNIGSDTGMSTDQTDTSPGVEPQEPLPTETAEVPMSSSHVPR